MNQIWAISKGALFRQIENGLFVVQFAHNKDRTKVLDGRPWTFDQHSVMLDEVKGNQQPSDIVLTHCPFWIRFYNLPLNSRTLGDVRTIAGKFGEVMEVERDGVVWDKSVRARVMLNIMKPLRRFVRIRNKEGNIVSIEVKYERLPTFYYACGEIGHIKRDCEKVAEEDKDSDKQWGSWLRASPRKGRIKMNEEAKSFLNSSKTLSMASKEKAHPNKQYDQVENHVTEVVNPIQKSPEEGVFRLHGGAIEWRKMVRMKS
ncbi:RNA helicase NPH-II [Bienertia sinuspersici]